MLGSFCVFHSFSSLSSLSSCAVDILHPSGEVCIKGAMVMKGYNNLPEKTDEAIDSRGYFHSGDIGKMEGGFVYILDRMKDLVSAFCVNFS